MIIYGTKIYSDIQFPLTLPCNGSTEYELKLSANPPKHIKQAITCGFPLYFAHGRKVYLYSNQVMGRSDHGQPWCYEVKDVLSFYWQSGEPVIYYVMNNSCTPELLSFWFIHLLLPLYFTLENMYDFLHGGAVEVNNKPIIFIAPSMGGKSTLTNLFLQQGHTLLSDDKIPTYIKNNTFLIAGSHPYHRPYRSFEDLGILSKRFQHLGVPIHAFYSLRKSAPRATIKITEIKGFKKFDTLMPNYLYMFSFLKEHRLSYLAKMLHTIKLFEIRVPWDLKRLKDVSHQISKHCKAIE